MRLRITALDHAILTNGAKRKPRTPVACLLLNLKIVNQSMTCHENCWVWLFSIFAKLTWCQQLTGKLILHPLLRNSQVNNPPINHTRIIISLSGHIKLFDIHHVWSIMAESIIFDMDEPDRLVDRGDNLKRQAGNAWCTKPCLEKVFENLTSVLTSN